MRARLLLSMADRTDDATSLPRPGDVVAGRYRIEREIGSGGMAVVYAATQLGAGSRQVALKWLFQGRSNRDERRRRFLREARAAGSIDHPNVVRVYDAGEHESGVYLVMELVAGQSLTSYLKERGKLSPREAIDLLMTAMRGVAAANRQGIVHRDLKPDNLIVCGADRERPEVKVLDFGLSKLVGPAADSLHTLPGTLVGTPHYMAPEQADGRIGEVSERADVYTLAAILYEALAGRRPFESETLAGQLMKLAHEEPTPLGEVADVPEELANMVMWALARDPRERPSSVEELALGLEPFGTVGFASMGRQPPTGGSVRAPRRPSDRAPAAPAALAAPPASRRAPFMGVGIGAGILALIAVGMAIAARERAQDETERTSPATMANAREPARAVTTVPASPPAPAAVFVDAGSVNPPSPTPSEPPIEGARAATPSTPEATAPQPPAETAPGEELPPSDDAPTRRKRSPGVADPWDDN